MRFNFDKEYLLHTLIPALNAVVLQTELAGNTSFITKFSLAGATSTYSFGLYQYDVGNHPAARLLLAQFGFSPAQIAQLSQQGGLTPAQQNALSAQLKAALAIPANAAALRDLDSSWAQKLIASLANILDIVAASGAMGARIAGQIFNSTVLQLHLLDFANQFNISPTGSMVAWLEGKAVIMPGGKKQLLPETVLTKELIRDFIMSTQYGVAHPIPETTRENALFKVLATVPAGLPKFYVDPSIPVPQPRGRESTG